MKNDTEIKIQETLDEMQQMFKVAIGPRNRREYMNSIGVSGRDWHFGLTPEEQIIKNKIPANVIGCTGRAKLFCELAKRKGIKSYVVCTALYDDWKAVKQGEDKTINGHQINAVEIDGKMMVFDAGRKHLKFINTDLKPGSFIDAMDSGKLDYMISAIVPGDEFQHVDTYKKLRNLYTSGDIANDHFTIKPKLFQRATKRVYNNILQKIKIRHMAQQTEI